MEPEHNVSSSTSQNSETAARIDTATQQPAASENTSADQKPVKGQPSAAPAQTPTTMQQPAAPQPAAPQPAEAAAAADTPASPQPGPTQPAPVSAGAAAAPASAFPAPSVAVGAPATDAGVSSATAATAVAIGTASSPVVGGNLTPATAPTTRKKAGYYYPNKFALITLNALEEVMGKNGINTVLRRAKLDDYIDNYPADNLKKEFDFADYTALNEVIDELYGYRGGRGLAMRAGRAIFAQGLRAFGAMAGVANYTFKALPLSVKLRMGLPSLANIFNQFSDQISHVHNNDDHFIYTIERSPICWDRTSDRPTCHLAVGLLKESLRWVSGNKEFKIDEISCMSKGDEMCQFIIYKEPIE